MARPESAMRRVLPHLPKLRARASAMARSAAALLIFHSAFAAEDGVSIMRDVTRAAREGNLDGLGALSRVHDARAAGLVLELVAESRVSFFVREEIARLVAAWPAGAGQDYLITALQRKPDVPLETLQFYTSLRLPALQPVFLSMLAAQKSVAPDLIKNPLHYAAIVRALEHYPDQRDTVVSHIISLLDDKAPHVLRASAATALGGIRSSNGIPALLARVNDRAIGVLALDSLYRLTGQDHGLEVSAWTAWLEGPGKDAPPRMLSREDLAKHRAERRAAAAQNADDLSTFYGLELKGRHIVFVLDVSGSMSGPLIEQLRGQTTNLLNLLQSRSGGLRYAILTFASGVDSCAGTRGLMENDDASFKKASKFVERMKADGGTAMVGAVKYVADKLLPDCNVDTIYLLSDGSPSDGTPEDAMAIVSRVHYQYQVTMHTISITGPKPPPDPAAPPPTEPVELSLLEQMARHTGGDFKEL